MLISGQDGVDFETGVCHCDADRVNGCDNDDGGDDGDTGRVVDGGVCDDCRDCSDDGEGGFDDHSLVCCVGCHADIYAGDYVGCNAFCKSNSI